MYNTDIPTRAELPSSAQLLRSTAIAAGVAAILLVTAVLPGEYGIDPTGAGRLLGLTSMGEIKVQLQQEAEADAKADAQRLAASTPTLETPRATTQPMANPAPPLISAQPTAPPATPPTGPAPTPRTNAVASSDQTSITLRPGQGAEVKLTMKQGATVSYIWTTQGGPVNFDTHGDPVNPPKDFYHGYGKGRQVNEDSGEIKAAFDGKHGWFWRNRTKQDVTITLKTTGDYKELKRVL